ncbi:AraC family transcriptional regulator [Anaerosporobacter sp.]|uniref:AraC family transcriptional regulator n=1 Tax=Anaerosporobacter sp. TaxID=1872529 RepID=UPI00286F44ED|nr:effector binding domain-containing protein [Anaerosporobacter sp.]
MNGDAAVNYYERIQKSIDYMEDNLEYDIKVEEIAKEAYMSVSSFHRIFFAITGYRVKEYLINRRIGKSSEELKMNQTKVIDIAMKYAYDSVDAFSRIFKKVTGHTPSSCAKGMYQYKFERMNVMENYFEMDEQGMLEQYPDIKVLKNLPQMRVAYYCFYGKDPESGAFSEMKKWVQANGVDYRNENYRIFGYNAPDTDASAEEYGYEVCVTIPEDMEVTDEKIKTKTLHGGLYAVVSIEPKEDLGEEIMLGWKRFSKWLEGSKYVYGEAQWLEEHLGFGDDFEHLGGVDLYMPIAVKPKLEEIEMIEEEIEPFTVATYTATGRGAEEKARKYMFKWLMEQGIDLADENVRIFAFYNFEQINKPGYFYKLYIKIAEDMDITDSKIEKEVFQGGMYLKNHVKYKVNGPSWFNFIQSIEQSKIYSFGLQPFMEEYLITKTIIDSETEIIQHMPVTKEISM